MYGVVSSQKWAHFSWKKQNLSIPVHIQNINYGYSREIFAHLVDGRCLGSLPQIGVALPQTSNFLLRLLKTELRLAGEGLRKLLLLKLQYANFVAKSGMYLSELVHGL